MRYSAAGADAGDCVVSRGGALVSSESDRNASKSSQPAFIDAYPQANPNSILLPGPTARYLSLLPPHLLGTTYEVLRSPSQAGCIEVLERIGGVCERKRGRVGEDHAAGYPFNDRKIRVGAGSLLHKGADTADAGG